MRRFWMVAVPVLCVAAVGTALMAPERFHRIEMASETDGRHQDDHKVFGYLPYSTIRDDARLHVTDDAFRRLEKAGLKNLPESRTQRPSYPVARMLRQGKTEYYLPFELLKKAPKDAVDFYARQMVKPVRTSGPGQEGVEGRCPDGKTKVSFSVIGREAALRF